MFYGVSFLMILLRIFELLKAMKNAENFSIFGTLMPPVNMATIGVVQTEVIIELILRVRESNRQLEMNRL